MPATGTQHTLFWWQQRMSGEHVLVTVDFATGQLRELTPATPGIGFDLPYFGMQAGDSHLVNWPAVPGDTCSADITDTAGERWFATASRRTRPGDVADLRATMRAARELADAGLDFVVAPVPACGGDVLIAGPPGYAISLFPFADGIPGHWGEAITASDRVAVIELLAVLHNAGPLAGGVPVVAARVGAYETLIRDGETGTLIPREDVDALAAALDRWLSDDAGRAAAGRAARAHVEENHAIESEARAIVAVYRRLLETGR